MSSQALALLNAVNELMQKTNGSKQNQKYEHQKTSTPPIKITILKHKEPRSDSILIAIEGMIGPLIHVISRELVHVKGIALDPLTFTLGHAKSNNGMMTDSELRDRVTLVPMKCHPNLLDRLISPQECTCERGCSKCQIAFSLNITSPMDRQFNVLTSELRLRRDPTTTADAGTTAHEVEKEREMRVESLRPLREDICLTIMGKHRDLHFSVGARTGTAAQHGRWTTHHMAIHRPRVDIRIDDDFNEITTVQERRELSRVCAPKVFELSSASNNDDRCQILPITQSRADRCNRCGSCTPVIQAIRNRINHNQTNIQPTAFAPPPPSSSFRLASSPSPSRRVSDSTSFSTSPSLKDVATVEDCKTKFLYSLQRSYIYKPNDLLARACRSLVQRCRTIREFTLENLL
jgi:DNA-directed RNA polymerase alpha subunit